MKNKRNLLIIIFSSLLFVILLYFLSNISKKVLIVESVKDTQNFSEIYFKTFESQDTKALAATLDSVLQDPGFKEVFLKQNREELNKYGQSLFQKLKEEYGITHFYFILPDSTVFLRLHDPTLFGDVVKRVTFKQAVDSNRVGSGLELGKTAFALRVVKPYYDDGKLIGYVELGQEIEHFLSTLKNQTNNEYSMFVSKNNLNKENWSSAQKSNGLADNWEQFKEFISINDTLSDNEDANIIKKTCFSEVNAKAVFSSKEPIVLLNNPDSNRGCTGFAFRDASGKVVGSVLIVTDLLVQIKATNWFIFWNVLVIIGLLIFTLFSFYYYSRKTRSAEVRYKYLFDYSNDAIMTLSPPDWKFSDGNKATFKLYGLKDNEELRSVNPGDLSPERQPDGSLSSEKAKEIIGIAIEKGQKTFEWTHKKLNGPEFLANVSLTKIVENGKVYLQAVVRDITAEKGAIEMIKKSEKEARKALTEAEKANKLMVGRELEMIKLKKQLLDYKKQDED